MTVCSILGTLVPTHGPTTVGSIGLVGDTVEGTSGGLRLLAGEPGGMTAAKSALTEKG